MTLRVADRVLERGWPCRRVPGATVTPRQPRGTARLDPLILVPFLFVFGLPIQLYLLVTCVLFYIHIHNWELPYHKLSQVKL